MHIVQRTNRVGRYQTLRGQLHWKVLSRCSYCLTLSLCKALLLLAYLIRNGSERVVTSAREHIYDLRSLENYHFIGDFLKLNYIFHRLFVSYYIFYTNVSCIVFDLA